MLTRKRIIIFSIAGLGVFILLIVLLFASIGGMGGDETITLTFWGTFDDPAWYEGAIAEFRKTHPRTYIIYKDLPYEEYESTLINAFASGQGPDIWLMHNSWLPKHINKIAPMPERIKGRDEPLMLFRDFLDQFVDVTAYDLTAGGKIYAAPIYVDTLALYYNRNMFNDAGIVSPPATWDEFNQDVKLLTRRDASGNIMRSGAAIGTARNINRSTDIFAMLLLQGKARMTDDKNEKATFANTVQGARVGESALQYYTDFANRTNGLYTWDDLQHYSIDAFAQGETAMMFNYSHHIPTIRSKSARFNFGIAPVPQLANSEFDKTYASYWAPTVSKQSKYIDRAWEFLDYLMSFEGSSYYINASSRPSARRDIIARQRTDPDLGVFAEQALSAVSWYRIDNVAIDTIFADMIDDVNFNRKTVPEALRAAQNRVNVLMSRGM